MTCCADDIQFAGLVCNYSAADKLNNKQWAYISAKIRVEKHSAYGRIGPVLYVSDVSLTTPPESEVATFY